MKRIVIAGLILGAILGVGVGTVFGCTPGYWKNHVDEWAPTGYTPDDDFDTTFGVDAFDPDIILVDALNAKGGGINALARHAVAALLNAAHPDVTYPLTETEVIAIVQAVDLGDRDSIEAAKDELESLNELGCLDN